MSQTVINQQSTRKMRQEEARQFRELIKLIPQKNRPAAPSQPSAPHECGVSTIDLETQVAGNTTCMGQLPR